MRKLFVAYVGASSGGVLISTDAIAILPPALGHRRATTQRADLRNCPLHMVKRWEMWCRRSFPALVCIRCLKR
jgi:hypothetical protein